MLAVAVRFVTGRYYAASHADRARPEWPPHPDRLFSALVAACYQACGGTGRSALEWLERQGAPLLAASRMPRECADGRTMLAMVRTNDASSRSDGERVLPDRRKPQARVFPSIAVEDPVYFIWPEARPDADTAAALALITSHMAYLGSSKSPIVAWIEEMPPAPTLLPTTEPTGSEEAVALRVPTPGRLAELDVQYAAGLRPQPGHQQPYHWRVPSALAEPPKPHPSSFGELFILERTSGPTPSLEATLTVTHALRRALLVVADAYVGATPGASVPEILHGHGPPESPHCAFVALPHVGAPHADGHLLGVAVVFPRECDAEQRRVVLRALGSLEHVQTPVGRIGVVPVAQLSPDGLPWGLQSARWCGPDDGATTWTSVTPVLFDRFPRASRGGVFDTVQALARHAGLPAPIEATAHQISPLSGVVPARAYRVRRATDDTPRYVAHVTVTFDRPVAGPVMLGAGRFFGLGLCVPYAAGNR